MSAKTHTFARIKTVIIATTATALIVALIGSVVQVATAQSGTPVQTRTHAKVDVNKDGKN